MRFGGKMLKIILKSVFISSWVILIDDSKNLKQENA